MKKIILTTLLVMLSTGVYAEKKGGFEGGEAPQPQSKQDAGYKGSEDTGQTHINQIRDFRPGGYVTLEGYIVKKEQGDNYLFRDSTGNITIIAPEKAFKGKTYQADDQVRVSGKVQGKGEKTQLHVTQITEP
ncbi:MAG: NirD/YgiW/YdeI family stress tolerance protein [Enterobacterales bacterium endosymbiont of Blomia tropicalis]|uniref:YgiW/YdeI family stress tolerance OB fold protein n=1 Tax=Mixta mediterraneensis TaxID=2758443 RepID=UPI001874BD67|nr:NirD/YgiW/YdeI family stress tolerance protein [Mixta mediterraneensis]MBE5251124.1 NirD/YgiW/YdeI family stress tolerance protein [Mixta mediterraneensis]MDL4914884.1 NirD/YgiW/YdeI family stress tolerance protein [Mixta mediterraneensis]